MQIRKRGGPPKTVAVCRGAPEERAPTLPSRLENGSGASSSPLQAGPDRLVLEPRERYEGAHLPVVASPSGPSKGEVCGVVGARACPSHGSDARCAAG